MPLAAFLLAGSLLRGERRALSPLTRIIFSREPLLEQHVQHHEHVPIAFGLSFVVGLATAWFVVRWRRDRLLEIECALLSIVMCLVVSHANTDYFVFALPALSIALAVVVKRPDIVGIVPKMALAAAIVLSGFLVPMKVFEVLTHIQSLFVARVLQGWSAARVRRHAGREAHGRAASNCARLRGLGRAARVVN